MHLVIQSKDLGRVTVTMREETKQRLATTCFRGGKNLAGNFSQWENAEKLFAEEDVIQALLADANQAMQERSSTNSFSINWRTPVGWSGTDDFKKYSQKDLTNYNPNRRSSALRVRIGHQLPAPRTDILTIVYEITQRVNPGIIIHTIYPGRDIGELEGKITDRENVVFFDWNHPGALP